MGHGERIVDVITMWGVPVLGPSTRSPVRKPKARPGLGEQWSPTAARACCVMKIGNAAASLADVAGPATGVQEMAHATGIGSTAAFPLPPRAEAASEREVASGTRYLAVLLRFPCTVPSGLQLLRRRCTSTESRQDGGKARTNRWQPGGYDLRRLRRPSRSAWVVARQQHVW